MSRNVILVLGTMLWAMLAVVVVLHAIAGDLAGPVVATILVTAGLIVRQLRRRMLRAS
jgi:hypothetical protein